MDEIDALIGEIERDAREVGASTGRPVIAARVLDAIRRVPRAHFMAKGVGRRAWRNQAAPIGHGQTISQPFIVALMTDLLDLRGAERVLEIGTGSGYQAAVLAALGCTVFSVEIIPALAEAARATLAGQDAPVRLRLGDGAEGWPDEAPFDAVIVTASAPAIPPALVAQLRPCGRMVAPLGPMRGEQELVALHKGRDGVMTCASVLKVSFVNLTGAEGFPAGGRTA